MNKKQELVKKVVDNLERAQVVLGEGEELRAPEGFWRQYPQGHCNDTMVSLSVECLLSCLTNKNLDAIAKLGPPATGVKFSAWWRDLGQTGYLKDDPILMDVDRIPVLRIRHDSYLSWFRGYRFQNSYDAFGNGSNGESWGSMPDAVSMCKAVLHPDAIDLCANITQEELNTFCKAVMFSFPFSACRGKSTFYKALQKSPEVFNDFLQQTDDRLMHIGLSKDLSMAKLCEVMSNSEMNSPTCAQFPIIYEEMQVALLSIGETSIQLVWPVCEERHTYTVNFPHWGYEASLDEPVYRATAWKCVATTMLALAGFTVTERYISPVSATKFDSAAPIFYPKGSYIDTLQGLYTQLEETAQRQTER